MLKTRFTELVGCSVPIQQAGMGAVAPPELAAAVSEAGGLGMLGTARPGGHSVKGLSSLLDRLTALTARPFGVNFIVSPLGLPDAPHRCLRSCVTAAEAFQGEVVGETPQLDGTRVAVRRLDSLAVNRGTTGLIEAMPLWAGESVSAVKRVQPAAEIVRELVEEAEPLLQSWGAAHLESALTPA